MPCLNIKKDKMKIPKELQIGGLKYTVVFNDKLADDKGVLGEINHHTHEILITHKSKHGKLTDEFVEQTYLHEVIHAILEIMQETELNDNEKFVNTFSAFIHQVIKQLD